MERGACSQQSALWARIFATAHSHSEKSAESSSTGRENTGVTALAGRGQLPDRAHHCPAGTAGPAQSPKRGHGRNGKNRETGHRDCEGRGRRDGGNKTHLGKMHVAEERQFGWVAFHADEGAKGEETRRWLLVSSPRATDLKQHQPPTQAVKVLSFRTTNLAG